MSKGLVICIEPMINLGRRNSSVERRWTIKTIDGKPSAHFEYAVAVDKKADVLTTFDFVEEVLNKI